MATAREINMATAKPPSMILIILLAIPSFIFRMLGFICTLIILMTLIYIGVQFLTNSNQFYLVRELNHFVNPLLRYTHQYIPTVYKNYDLAPIILIVLTIIIRSFILNFAYSFRLKYRILYDKRAFILKNAPPKERAPQEYVPKEAVIAVEQPSYGGDDIVTPAVDLETGKNRNSLLKQFIEVKRKLEEAQKALSFLAVDVVGSTKMKAQEDKAMVEYTFAEYKKFIDEILMANRLWKVAWTPDGIMCAFWSPDDALNAGKEIIIGLDAFNKYINQMQTPFKVRCGVNCGTVMFDISAGMEEVSDEVIDHAGHLQKYAAPDTIWIDQKTLELISNKEGFKPIEQLVDDLPAAEWAPPK